MSDVQETSKRADFSTTQWTVVLESMQVDSNRAQAALQKLCSRYWYPVYAFIRHKGYAHHEAEDLTQGFFHHLINREAYKAADQKKGRFRTFLLTSVSNFLRNERDRAQTQKRGGLHEIVSINEQLAEETYLHEPMNVTPETHFDRSWAAMMARQVFDQLREDYQKRGHAAIFAALQPYLTGEPEPGTFENVGRQLEMEPGAVKVALHRARRRFGELLRREVAHTVNDPAEVEPEIRQLLAGLEQNGS